MKSFKEFLLEEVEDWKDQIATNDETGKKYRVKDIYEYAKKNTKLIKDLPIKDTDALEWWDKQYDMDNKEHKARMEKADTGVPVLGVRQEDGTISITDGLNRIKKAHHLEKKTTISAYVIDKKDMDNIPSIKENTNEDYDVYLDMPKKKKKRSKKKAKRYTLPYYGFNLYGYNNNNTDGESGGGDGGGGGE